MKNIFDYVDDVFSETGIIVKLGGRYTPEQHEYATGIAKCLINPEQALGLLQADTGIGKSLGYLVPSVLYVVLNPNFNDKKIVISTFTRYLQKQIIDHDLPFIRKILLELGFDISSLLITYRMGRQSFFSVERTKYATSKIILDDPDRKEELESFIDYVVESCSFGSGLWLDYFEENGDLPKGIKVDDICLLNSQKSDNEAYDLHLDRVASADIIVTNHHSCVLADRTGLSNFKIHAMIFDEAHKIASICFDLFNYKINLAEIKRNLNYVADHPKVKKASLVSLGHILELEEKVKSHPRFNELEYLTQQNSTALFSEIKLTISKLQSALTKTLNLYSESLDKASLSFQDAEFIDSMSSINFSLSAWNNEKELSLSAIGISPQRKQISIAYLNLYASNLFGFITKGLTDRIILTSATLANAQQEISFGLTKTHLGLSKMPCTVELIVSPSRYADMHFVLMTKDCPSPVSTVDENQISFDSKWLSNTALMIKAAKESGDNVLILTNSHHETKILSETIADLQPLVHKQGTALKEYLKDFKKPNQILITCAGWEGLNLRQDDGTQLIYHVVITRIPFNPPNPIIEYAVKSFYNKTVKLQSYLLNIQWVLSMQEVVSKLKQGMGRGTRSPNDFVTIWIADSRMPHPMNDKSNGILLNAVPKRFMNNYRKAEIFLEKKKELFFI